MIKLIINLERFLKEILVNPNPFKESHVISEPRHEVDVQKLHKGSIKVLTTSGLRVSRNQTFKTALERNRDKMNMQDILLPDVSQFKLELGDYNPLLLSWGIITRHGSNKTIVENRNRRANRYLLYMQNRMLKSLEEKRYENYWKIASILLILSNSYLISNIQYKDKNLYRKITLEKLTQLLTKIQSLRGHNSNRKTLRSFQKGQINGYDIMNHYINYKRFYLPKGTSWRPLGVPTQAWRIYNSMLLHPLTGFFNIDANQQGFVPRRGTLTAWQRLLKEVIPSRNILEIDFEGFYPSISSKMVMEGCRSHSRECPTAVLQFYEEMSDSKPRLTFNPKEDHSKQRLLMIDPLVNTSWISSYGSNFAKEQLNRGKSSEKTITARWLCLHKKLLESRRLREKAIREIHSGGKPYYKSEYRTLQGDRLHTTGLPQGAGTSPYLSVLYLDYVLKRIQVHYPSIKYLCYADDIILYSDNDSEFDIFLQSLNLKLGTRFMSLVDYSASQLENKGAGFSGARTSNLTQDQTLDPSWVKHINMWSSDPIRNRTTYRNDLQRTSLPTDPFASQGLKISIKKSQVSKWHNLQQMSFIKFLGITYNLGKGTLQSSTRSGRKLIFNFYDLVDEIRSYELEKFTFRRINLWRRLLVQLDRENISKVLSSQLLRYTLAKGLSKKLLVHYLTKGFKSTKSTELTQERVIERNVLSLYLEYRLKQFLHPIINSYKTWKKNEVPRTAPGQIFDTVYSGLLQSRLYMGNKLIPRFDTPSGLQDFRLKYTPGSLGNTLQSVGLRMTISNGSSYATNFLLEKTRNPRITPSQYVSGLKPVKYCLSRK